MSFLQSLDLWDDNAVYGLERFLSDWVRKSCAIVAGAAQRAGHLAGDESRKLTTACELLSDDAQATARVSTYLFDITHGDDSIEQQIVHLARGLCFGVRAASRLADWQSVSSVPLPPEAIDDLQQCFAAYHAAWDLWTPKVTAVVGTAARGRVPVSDRAGNIVEQFVDLHRQNLPQWLTHSTSLLVRRLLQYVLDPQTVETPLLGDPVTLEMLLVKESPPTSGMYIGLTAPVTIAAYDEGWPSAYLDPVEMGVTILDDRMLESLRVATRVCRHELERKFAHGKNWPSIALRIGPNLRGQRLAILSGASAGGLLTVGAVAKSWGLRLNRRMTASIVINCTRLAHNDPNQVLKAEDITLNPVSEASLNAKLERAARDNITTVFLSPQQADQGGATFQQWAPAVQQRLKLLLLPATSIPAVIHAMTGDERIERALADRCDKIAKEWGEIAQAKESSDKTITQKQEYAEHRFDRYVAPKFHIEKPRPKLPMRGEHLSEIPESEAVPGAGDECLAHLLDRLTRHNEPRWLAVYDRAGAGKTVFSWRIRKFAAEARQRFFPKCPPLIVHIRGVWPRDASDRLLSLKELLLRELGTLPQPAGVDPGECVAYALEHRSVLMILDGFDQFRPDEQRHVETLLHGNTARADPQAIDDCHWIVTSRVHTIDDLRATLFDDRRWLRVRIDPFSRQQQDAYFDRTPQDWRSMVPEGDPAAEDLLGLPMVLRLLREVLEATPPAEQLPQFATLSALFAHVARALLQRALRTSRQRLADGRLERSELDDAEQLRLLEHVLSLLAIQMLLDENYNGSIGGDKGGQQAHVEAFEQKARIRFFRDTDEALALNALPASEKLRLEEQLRLRLTDWVWAVAVLKTIELNHRTVTEAYQPQRVAFRSRKMVECYAARYLTRYATDWDLVGRDDLHDLGDPCAWSFIGDEQWKECWKLAIEMPLESKTDKDVAGMSFGLLFRRPKARMNSIWGSGPQLRPTELMFRACQFMTRTELPSLGTILDAYRQQFLDMLTDSDDALATIARRLTPESSPNGLVVTRAQFRLFDPKVEIANRLGVCHYAPESEGPITFTSWYGAACFAMWLGPRASLPLESKGETVVIQAGHRTIQSHQATAPQNYAPDARNYFGVRLVWLPEPINMGSGIDVALGH